MAWPLPISVCSAVMMLGRKYVASSQLKPLALFTAYLVGCSLLILFLGQTLARRHYLCAGLAGSGRDLLLFDHLRDGHLHMQMIHPTDTSVSLKQRPTSVPPCIQRSVIFFTTSVATCYILPWVSWTHHLGPSPVSLCPPRGYVDWSINSIFHSFAWFSHMWAASVLHDHCTFEQ